MSLKRTMNGLGVVNCRISEIQSSVDPALDPPMESMFDVLSVYKELASRTPFGAANPTLVWCFNVFWPFNFFHLLSLPTSFIGPPLV